MDERMRIDSSGNVGIGTTSPNAKVTISETGTLTGGDINANADGLVVDNNGGNTGLTFKTPNSASSRIAFGDPEDNNVGQILYNHSTDDLTITAADNIILEGDAVGIGTTSPDTPLTISRATTGDVLKGLSTNNNTRSRITLQGKDSSGNAVTLMLGGDGDFGGMVFTHSNHKLGFATNNAAPQMVLDTAGNLGIGTSSPNSRLNLNIGGDQNWLQIDKSRAANEAMLQLIHSAGNRAATIRFANADDGWKVGIDGTEAFTFANGATTTGDGTERMRINSSGSLLLGTTNDLGHLTVSQVQNDTSSGTFTDPHIRLEAANTTNNTGFTGIAYSVSTLSNYGWTAGAQRVTTSGQDGAFVFRFHNNSATGTEFIRINNAGVLLLKTTGVGGGLGGVRLQNPDVGSCRFGTSGSGQITYIQFINNNGASITGSITGNASSTSFNTSSDYRLKENESLISDGITRLKQLKPYRFNWKSDSSTIVDGFFAHEVSSIVPESITGTKDAVAVQEDVDKGIADAIGEPIYQSIDQAKLVPLLTAALQEAIAKIEVLETEVAALKAA